MAKIRFEKPDQWNDRNGTHVSIDVRRGTILIGAIIGRGTRTSALPYSYHRASEQDPEVPGEWGTVTEAKAAVRAALEPEDGDFTGGKTVNLRRNP